MINNFTPFIQFVAAIYFSMCFEQIIGKYFWSKQHAEEIAEMFKKVEQNFELTALDSKEINESLNKKQDLFFVSVRKSSVCMLVLSIFVLFFAGLEEIYKFSIPCCLCIIFSFGLILPAVYFFIKGWRKTTHAIGSEKQGRGQEIHRCLA